MTTPLITFHKEALERLALLFAAEANIVMDDDGDVSTEWNWEAPDGPTETPLALTVFVEEE